MYFCTHVIPYGISDLSESPIGSSKVIVSAMTFTFQPEFGQGWTSPLYV